MQDVLDGMGGEAAALRSLPLLVHHPAAAPVRDYHSSYEMKCELVFCEHILSL